MNGNSIQDKIDAKRSSQSPPLLTVTNQLLKEEETLREGGGEKGRERQKRLGRMTARERIEFLADDPKELLEFGLWAGYQLYPEVGDLPAAGVLTCIGKVSGRTCCIVANDATVKAGAAFPATVKKMLRAQRLAFESRLPVIYLVDSSGVFLPMQDEIFPDEDDFGRIFRNNAIFSAQGIPQIAAVMGNCIAGGAYLPVLCDKLLMTEGSGLYLAGPALVKAAIGQEVDPEALGGAEMHASISGTVDFHEKDDASCLDRIKSLVAMMKEDTLEPSAKRPQRNPMDVYEMIDPDGAVPYEAGDLINCVIDHGSGNEYKADYGQSLVCTYATIDGQPVGVIANQRQTTVSKNHGTEIGGVIYAESSDKAARFVMDCNQNGTPLLFLQDVMGFMVGKEAEAGGIIRSGAKLVNAVSNSVVPKITVVVGSSFGAGNYALCGKAYDPNYLLAWPNAKYAVMGADQASGVVFTIQKRAAERAGGVLDDEELTALRETVKAGYEEQQNIRYGAARGWIDGIIEPHRTREIVSKLLHNLARAPLPDAKSFHTGVIQT